MTPDEILDLAGALLQEHAYAHEGRTLAGWTIVLDRATRRAGICRYGTKTIGLSRPLLTIWPESEVRDTILHEIAHALAGANAGHGPGWQAWARKIGARPKRTSAPGLPAPAGAWVGTCPAGHTVDRSRQPKRSVSCAICCPGRFSREHMFAWARRGATQAPAPVVRRLEPVAALDVPPSSPAPALGPARKVPGSVQGSLF